MRQAEVQLGSQLQGAQKVAYMMLPQVLLGTVTSVSIAEVCNRTPYVIVELGACKAAGLPDTLLPELTKPTAPDSAMCLLIGKPKLSVHDLLASLTRAVYFSSLDGIMSVPT